MPQLFGDVPDGLTTHASNRPEVRICNLIQTSKYPATNRPRDCRANNYLRAVLRLGLPQALCGEGEAVDDQELPSVLGYAL